MPRPLYRFALPEGTRLALARLYDDVDDAEAVRAWEEGRSEAPPFVWRVVAEGNKALVEDLARSRSSVFEDLARLRQAGLVRAAKRDGRTGLELLGTRRESAQPDCGSENTDGKSEQPDSRGPPARTRSPNPRTASPSSRTPSPPGRTLAPAHAVLIQQEQHRDEPAKPEARRGGAANDPPASSTTTRAARLAPPAVQAPARALLLRLAHEFGELFVPTTADGAPLESRRIRPDADTLRRLAELLTPPDDVDAQAWTAREVERVRSYVTTYAEICRADPEQARSWGSRMLETRTTAWETTMRIVDRWREEQAAAATAEREAQAHAAAAEARAVAERLAELEQLARTGETPGEREVREQLGLPARDHRADHAAALAAQRAAREAGRPLALADLNAAVRAAPGPVEPASTPLPALPSMARVAPEAGRPPLTEDEEDALRLQGQLRVEVDDEFDLVGRRISVAIAEFERLARRPPTTRELEEIKRRASGEEETGT